MVAGGGLLGLEAAYALHELGLDVAVLERGPCLLRRQLDDTGAAILQSYLEGLGIQVELAAETASLESESGRVARVKLRSGRAMGCDLFLICAGITPDIRLAREAGLETNRGVVVDDAMRTSDASILAAGDAAEHGGQVYGLWPAAVKQAEVAAVNAVGGDSRYAGTVPETILKVAGIDLMSIGRFLPASEADVVVAELDDRAHRYRKLVLDQGRLVGAILIGHSTLAASVSGAIRAGADLGDEIEALRAGDWSVLDATRPAAA